MLKCEIMLTERIIIYVINTQLIQNWTSTLLMKFSQPHGHTHTFSCIGDINQLSKTPVKEQLQLWPPYLEGTRPKPPSDVRNRG